MGHGEGDVFRRVIPGACEFAIGPEGDEGGLVFCLEGGECEHGFQTFGCNQLSSLRESGIPNHSFRFATLVFGMTGVVGRCRLATLSLGPRHHMTYKGQFPKLVRHVHAVADDELVRAIEACVVALDIGGEVAGFVQ